MLVNKRTEIDMKQIRVGNRFRLLGKEWVVCWKDDHAKGDLKAEADKMEAFIRWPLAEADQLDWIEPEVKFTREQAEALKDRLNYPPGSPTWNQTAEDFSNWLDAHTSESSSFCDAYGNTFDPGDPNNK